MIAYDDIYEDDQTTATVTINVVRNVQGPQFFGQPYIDTIYENEPLGQSMIRVNSSDPDGVSYWI